uniref:Uncharacterized protein n=1 Tax=Quercus lobata TaxID=97700 RepID=A0A7N2KX55_QUELO
MNNSIYKRRRSAAAITSEETKTKAMEENYEIALFVFIDGAEGLDCPSTSIDQGIAYVLMLLALLLTYLILPLDASSYGF